jgi:hypothetical protein
MANMKLIEAKTVGAGGVAFITFSAIPQTYTDLKLYVSSKDNRAGQPNDDLAVQVGYNGTINTGSIYTFRRIWGNGSASNSDSSSGTALFCGMSSGATSTANVFGNNELYFSNYNSSVAKSVLVTGASENNDTTAWQVINQGSIATNDAITDIKIYGADASLLSENTTFYLYGISSTIVSGAKAYGGYVTEDTNYFYHTFLGSGTFTPTQSLTADYLVVAGGGGGSNGGGGAGGLRSTVGTTGGGGSLESPLSLTAQAYTVTVGAGGAGQNAGSLAGTNGSNSVFSTITSTAGGGAGAQVNSSEQNGKNGGSGGGTGFGRPGPSGTVGTGASGQGYDGGQAYSDQTTYTAGGGGGGAGAVGASVNSANGNGAAGGIGVSISTLATPTLTGISSYYAGGGGGASAQSQNKLQGAGGLGGGGAGSQYNTNSGTSNTGGGGGGRNDSVSNAGSGGSGIVIVRYAK